MNDTRTVLVRYNDNRWEKYPADKAEYWIRRRLEKEGLAPPPRLSDYRHSARTMKLVVPRLST